MKHFFTFITFILLTLSVTAQNTAHKYYPSQGARFLNNAGTDTLYNALTGGIHAPQFCKMDLNQDTVLDLVIFDRLGGKVSTFINNGTSNKVDFIYAPEYEDLIPPVRNWMITRDYNRDGKMDIFTSLNDRNIVVYKNISTGTKLEFGTYTNLLRADRPETFATWDSISIFVFYRNLPAIDDIDGDGDIDILTFPTFGDAVDLFLNRQVDAGKEKDTIALSHVDYCWGSFGETFTGDIKLNFCTWAPNNVKFYKKRHDSGGTLAVYDVDGDGDVELFHGTLNVAGLKYLKNGKTETANKYDTMIDYADDYPFGQKKIDLYHYVSTFFMDMDNDGLNDMVVSVNGVAEVDEINQVWWYKNTGTNAIPDFKFQSTNLLQNTMVDLGGRTAPVFWDYDGDGDKDLLIGSNGGYSVTFNVADRLYLYENVGNEKMAIYKLIDDDYLSLSTEGISFMSPALGDINGDSKVDLLLGVLDGTIRYYTNTTVSGLPTFSLQEASLQSIDVGDYAAPFVIDLDRDNRLDLIVGTKGGNIHYYRNTGGTSTPAFQYITDSLGYVRINEYKANVNPPTYVDSGFAVPVIADVDGDGKYEMIVGGMEGKVRMYTNIEGNLTGAFDEVDSFLYNSTADTFLGSAKMGTMTYPTVADINNDGVMDIMIGNTRGGLTFWSTKKEKGGPIDRVKIQHLADHNLKLYPNPANNSVTLSRERNNISLAVTVVNTLGQVMLTDTFNQGDYKRSLDISGLEKGIYFVNFSAPSGETKTIKFTVIR